MKPPGTPPVSAADAARFDRALGAYLGLAIGDALGATVEFMTPREIRTTYGVHRELIGGGWLKLRPGDVTDDTTMSLALGAALVGAAPDLGHRNAMAQHMAQAFVGWLKSGPNDCGNTCRRGIRRYLADGSLEGPPSEGDGGNGALMRNLPVALATLDDATRFEDWSVMQAHLTHHHALSDAATLALGRMVQAAVRGEAWTAVQDEAARLVQALPVFRHTPWPGRASGYVVDTVQTVLHHVLPAQDLEWALIQVVNCGDDADTTGALAGMLLGARWGTEALPRRWLRALDARVVAAIRAQVPALLALGTPPPHSGIDLAPR